MLLGSKHTFFLSYCPLLQLHYSPSVWRLCFSARLFQYPLLKGPVCSDWSDITGLSCLPTVFPLQLCWYFCSQWCGAPRFEEMQWKYHFKCPCDRLNMVKFLLGRPSIGKNSCHFTFIRTFPALWCPFFIFLHLSLKHPESATGRNHLVSFFTGCFQ